MSVRKMIFLFALTTVVGLSHTAIAPASITEIGSFGTSGPGTLKGAEGIAVNANTNNVYVADKFDHRIVEYDQNGNFILTFGREVNETKVLEKQKGTLVTETEENVCTAMSGETCADGVQGSQPGQLNWPTSVAIDPNTGDVYVSDGGNERIEQYTPQGTYLSQIVSGQDGAPPFTVGATIENYDDNDNLEFVSYGNRSWVDAEGNLFLSVRSEPFTGVVYEFAPDGEYTGVALVAAGGEKRWESPQGPNAVVVGPSGRVYVSEGLEGAGEGAILAFENGSIVSRLPIGNACEKSNFGTADPLAVNLFTGEIINVDLNGTCEVVARVFTASGQQAMEFPVQRETYDGSQLYVSQAIAYGAGAGKLYQLTGGEEKVEVTVYGTFPLPLAAGPSVGDEDWSGLGLSAVTLSAKIDPHSSDTTYEIEYATDPGLVGASSVPVSPADTGSGFLPVNVSQEVSGLSQSTTYYYRVVAHNAFGGGAGSTVDGPVQSVTTLAPPPSVTTEGAGEVSFDTARVNGIVVPGSSGTASDTKWCFQYGSTEGPGYNLGFAPGTPAGDAGQGTSPVPVSFGLTHLVPGITYRYRLVAVNSLGSRLTSTACGTAGGHETDGAEQRFTTPSGGPPPLAVSSQVGDVSQNSATLTGTVYPQGAHTSYYFQIGTDTTYGVDLFGQASGEDESESVSVLVSGLLPGTTYHYRLVASNPNGVSYGTDESFTTPTFPSSVLIAPLAPALLTVPTVAFPKETSSVTPKALTNAQKLANALKACAKKPRKQRAGCVKQARKRYGPAKKHK